MSEGPSFARIPAWLIGHRDLAASDWRICLCIALHQNAETGWAFPSMETIAREANTRRQDVPRAIKRLEEAEALEVRRGGGRTFNMYRVRQGPKSEALSANLRTVTTPTVRNSADLTEVGTEVRTD